MNTIYCPMIVDKNGQKYLCIEDIDSYYINPTDKELEKVKEVLNTAYYSYSDAEKENILLKCLSLQLIKNLQMLMMNG